MKALLAILDDAPTSGSGHTLSQALHPVRPQVLGVLSMLCQAGADVARHLLGQGDAPSNNFCDAVNLKFHLGMPV